MMEFILWVIFTKIVSQVAIIKKIAIIKENHNYWKISWLFKKLVISEKIVVIEKDCDKINSVVI